MKCVIEPKFEDGGGDLVLTAENPTEVQAVIRHYKLFRVEDGNVDDRIKALLAEKEALERGTLEVQRPCQDPEKHRDPRAWYLITGSLDGEHPKLWGGGTQTYLDPYLVCMRYQLGFQGPIPDMDLTDQIDMDTMLAYTHILLHFRIENQVIHYRAAEEAGSWNGMSAKQNAHEYTRRSVAREVGGQRRESEYSENRKGTYSLNPNYLKQHAPQPALGSEWLLNCLLGWWKRNVASPRQLEIIAAMEVLYASSGLGPVFQADYDSTVSNFTTTYTIRPSSITYLDPQGTCDWDGEGTKASCLSWPDFAKLATG
jgi:hypothetical protein